MLNIALIGILLLFSLIIKYSEFYLRYDIFCSKKYSKKRFSLLISSLLYYFLA